MVFSQLIWAKVLTWLSSKGLGPTQLFLVTAPSQIGFSVNSFLVNLSEASSCIELRIVKR